MSMVHKAYVLDYDNFMKHLAPIIEQALRVDNADDLSVFIDSNIYTLHRYEGEQLTPDWKNQIPFEYRNVQTYADIALTKYYNPNLCLGLSYFWENVDEFLAHHSISLSLFGDILGKYPHHFDPGKIGSYFQSPSDVNENFKIIEQIVRTIPNIYFDFDTVQRDLRDGLDFAYEMFYQAFVRQ